MITKNHNIELNDTSASEMARFRQIMLNIWRQQIEYDRNSDEWDKILREQHATAKAIDKQYENSAVKPDEVIIKGKRYILNNENHYQFTNASPLEEVIVSPLPLDSILLWIKKNLGNKATELKPTSLPENTLIRFLSGSKKGNIIDCTRYQFEAIVDLKNIKFGVYFKPLKTYFLLGIFDQQNNLVFRFETNTYEGLEYLASFIGYDLEIFKKTIIQHYKTAISAAGNDKDRLDIIYEVIPDFILAALKADKDLYQEIDILLNQNIFDLGGRDEDLGILNILKALKKQNAKKLYHWLEKRPKKVLQIYDSGKSIRNEFLKLINQLAVTYGKQSNSEIYKAYVSSKDSFILKDIFLNTERLESGLINVKSLEGLDWKKFWADFVAQFNILDTKIGSDPIKLLTMPIHYGNPMHLASLTTSGQKAGELIEKTETLLMILHLSEQEKNKQFWELVSLTTSIIGTASALRVIALGGSKLALSLAYLEVTKEAVEMVMLSDKAKKLLRENNLGWLVDNWTKISIAVDITTFGLEGLVNLVKKGKKGIKILKDAGYSTEATKLEKEVNKAQKILHELKGSFIKLETKLAKTIGKEYDTFGNFEEVKAVEDIIRTQTKEFGMFFDGKGLALLDDIIIGADGVIDIDKSLMSAKKSIRANGGKFTDLVFTHNHYGNSALSPSDILATIKNNLRELRAVGSSGVDYSLKRIKPYPDEDSIKNILKNINNVMEGKYPKLHSTKYMTGGGNIEIAQFYAETILEKFGDYIEYTKFIK